MESEGNEKDKVIDEMQKDNSNDEKEMIIKDMRDRIEELEDENDQLLQVKDELENLNINLEGQL